LFGWQMFFDCWLTEKSAPGSRQQQNKSYSAAFKRLALWRIISVVF
jgi:hypothetical protein